MHGDALAAMEQLDGLWTELLALRATTRDLRNTIKASKRTIAESRALLEKIGDGSNIASTAPRQD